ncbi:transcription factor Sox-17-beta.1-like [Clytia hemisphaerica]
MTMSNGPLLHYHPSEEHQQTFTSQAHPLNHEGGNTPPSTRPDVCFNNSNNYTTFFHDHHTSHSTLMTSLQETDEDEVKRPMNSFLLWAKIMRKQYASKNPNMHNAEISKLLGKIWNSMTTKDKRPYVEQAERLRVVHMRTYPNYRYAPKRRKERRNHRMISPEVAAALHNTLFDVNNIINEQISQTDVLSQNLKSYGYLRSAFQQNRNKNIGNVSDSHSDSSFSRCNTASPLPCSEQSFSSAFIVRISTPIAGRKSNSYGTGQKPHGINDITLPTGHKHKLCCNHFHTTKSNTDCRLFFIFKQRIER